MAGCLFLAARQSGISPSGQLEAMQMKLMELNLMTHTGEDPPPPPSYLPQFPLSRHF